MSRAPDDDRFMRLALQEAHKGLGQTHPNPAVGAVIVKSGRVIASGYHARAGTAHAEANALMLAGKRAKGATIYSTLEPCDHFGRTPPCTQGILEAGITRVVYGSSDPNPLVDGKGLKRMRRAGLKVEGGVLAAECDALNEPFFKVMRTGLPFVTVKSAMTLDGKIATASGESKWITGEKARAEGMRLRAGADAILVGVNTVLADDPGLTVRQGPGSKVQGPRLRRIVLDSRARMPLKSNVVSDEFAALTTIVVGRSVPAKRVAALARTVSVVRAPLRGGRIDLRWLLKKLGRENVTSLLVEGGGEVNASFLLGGLAHRVVFFYAPKILGGRDSHKAVAGEGARSLGDVLSLSEVEWRRVGDDLMMTARVK